MFVHDLARERWEEGYQVDLFAELPAIKELVMQQRALEAQLDSENVAQQQ